MNTSTPGRRAAARRRTRVDRGTVKGLALVVLAALTVVAASWVDGEPPSETRPTSAPVDRVAAACLAARPAGTSEVLTFAAPLPGGSVSPEQDGGVTVGRAGQQAREVDPSRRGATRRLDAPAPGEALTVTATGGAAVGRATFQVDRTEDGSALALQECLPARSRWWFTGAGAGLDHRSELVMTNVDPGPAVVDVEVQGPDGVVDSVGTRGITIGPGEVRTVRLVEVAPQSDELSVHVEASRGRVVAAVADSFAAGPGATPGHEWLPVQEEAARVVRLAPLPTDADRRTLVVANPADREALVDVEVSGGSGAFAPTDTAQVRVPPGSVVTADLTDAVDDASAVLLRSPVRITATVRSEAAGDVAYAAAAPLLGGPAAASLVDGVSAAVHLTAGDDGATATATAYSADGDEVDSTRLEVPPTATLAWRPKGEAAYVVVAPGRGHVAGGVTLAGGAGLSQVPLRPLPVTLRRPAVVPVVR